MGGSFKLMRVGHQRKTSAVTRNSAFTRNTIVGASSKFDSLSFLASSSHTFAGGSLLAALEILPETPQHLCSIFQICFELHQREREREREIHFLLAAFCGKTDAELTRLHFWRWLCNTQRYTESDNVILLFLR